MAEEQPEEQVKRGRADHLKPHRFQKGQSGNPGGRPKGSVNLSKRIENKLLEALQSDDPRQIADAVAAAIVKVMLKDPVKAGKLIADFMDRDEGPVVKPQGPLIAIGIDARGRVPQVPPFFEAGADGAPMFGEHLGRLYAIAKERGLIGLDAAHPAEIVAILANRSAVEELLS